MLSSFNDDGLLYSRFLAQVKEVFTLYKLVIGEAPDIQLNFVSSQLLLAREHSARAKFSKFLSQLLIILLLSFLSNRLILPRPLTRILMAIPQVYMIWQQGQEFLEVFTLA